MQTAIWRDYFELLMEFEGEVFENDPADPGGATKYGIDARAHPGVDIAALTRRQAEKIHLGEFLACAGAKLPSPLSFCYFDLAMNAGAVAAARCLQRALGHRPVDGVCGPRTLAAAGVALAGDGGMGRLLLRYHSEREMFYKNLAFTRPKMGRYLRGWLRRAAAMHAWALGRMGGEGEA